MSRNFSNTPPAAAAGVGLTFQSMRVLVALGFHADRRGICWPSLTRLAAVTWLPRKKLPGLIRQLILAGYVEKAGRQPNGTTIYRVLYPPVVLKKRDEKAVAGVPSGGDGESPRRGEPGSPLWKVQGVPPGGAEVSPVRGTKVRKKHDNNKEVKQDSTPSTTKH